MESMQSSVRYLNQILIENIQLINFFQGKIIDGLFIVRKIENVPTGPNHKPKIPVVISQCGEMQVKLGGKNCKSIKSDVICIIIIFFKWHLSKCKINLK